MVLAGSIGLPSINVRTVTVAGESGALGLDVHIEIGTRSWFRGLGPTWCLACARRASSCRCGWVRGAIPAVVALDEPTGSSTMVVFFNAGQEVVATMPVSFRLAESAEVSLGVELDQACFFDPRSEARIEGVEEMTARYDSLHAARVFITGGATGIGAAMVRAFAGQGARVRFLDIAEAEGRALAAASPEQVSFDAVDVRDVAALQRAIGAFEASTGGIDVLINNVANDSRHDWRSLTPETWEANHAVNLRPMVFAIQAAAPGMMARGRGSILNFGSISWKLGAGDMLAYTTAKAAVHGVTRSLMKELGQSGVRINTVLPGWVLTPRQRQLHFDEAARVMKDELQPMPGELLPEDLANLALFLGAEESRMCTGQEFTMDGGWS